jgi:hypothetical protein
MKRFAFYQIGTTAIATNAFARRLGIETVTLPSPNLATIAKGISLSPEFSCFPFKVLLGSLAQGVERGADVFVVPFGRSVSACQLADFGMAQRYILRRLGHDFDIVQLNTVRPDRVLDSFRPHKPDLTLMQVSEGVLVAGQKLLLLERVEDHWRDIYLVSRKREAEAFREKWVRAIDRTDSILELLELGLKMDGTAPRTRRSIRGSGCGSRSSATCTPSTRRSSTTTSSSVSATSASSRRTASSCGCCSTRGSRRRRRTSWRSPPGRRGTCATTSAASPTTPCAAPSGSRKRGTTG